MTRLADEYTRLGDPVAFQYPDGVVRVGRPPRASRSRLGQKKNHCSPSRLHGSPDIAVQSKASRDALGVPLLCLYVIDRSSPGLIILLAFFASLFNVVGSVGSCSCCRLRVASALLSCNYLRKRRLGDDGRGRLFEPAHAVACRYGEQLVTLHASLPSSNLSNVSASLKSRLTSRHAARGRCQSRRFWSRELNGGMQSGAVVVVVVENCFVGGPKWASFYGWRNPPRGVGWLAGPHPQLVKRTLEVGRGTNLLPSVIFYAFFGY
ncbi:hypothetical protein BHM03_00027169 [Ensete ventricosum]|uniref:Uncharacterized protein n=1 Tax=Ensete ventricosum TaxID=4639 RepID=A0A445MHF4_ENSVE|nr:hypothetical protein BHM03_00027169 [Ensete ventricosum]